jgi:hypothetical protein
MKKQEAKQAAEAKAEGTVNADHDIRVASWHIADLLMGPDDGSVERDDIECQIQRVMVESFSDTAGRDPVFGPVDPTNPPPGFQPARPPMPVGLLRPQKES